MSMPSAMNATLTPLPVAIECACGTLGFGFSVLVRLSASGSSCGLLGSDVHWARPPGWSVGPALVPAVAGSGMMRSGTTSATCGLASSLLISLCVAVAATALTVSSCWTWVAP